MAESSSQNPSSPEITTKEELITLDKPNSPNHFLPAIQVEFTFEEIAFTTNNEVVLLYPSHPNQEYFKDESNFIFKCCLKEAFTKTPTQYKEYLSEFWHTTKVLPYSKIWVSIPTGEVRGEIVVGEMHKEAHQAAGDPTSLGATSEEGAHPQLSSDILKDTRSAFFTFDSIPDDPIIISDKSEEEEEVSKDKDTEDTSEELEQAKVKAKAEVASIKAKPSNPDINQLTKLLVTSLKPELSKPLFSHDLASCFPTELKELPSKITGLSREIKELQHHIKCMEIELPGDLIKIPTKLESFIYTISSLSSQVAKLKNIQWKLPIKFLNLPAQVSSVQEKLKTLDSLPSLLHKVIDTLNRFATMEENASGAASMNVPSTCQATASPAEGEKNTKDDDTNIKDKLIDLLGKNVMTQYYTKKLLFDKYCDKILKRRKVVLRRLGRIFTSVNTAVHKLKKDSWLELQFSLVDNSKLNVVYLLNRS
nr:hypothetical protein [Tanacetum cinerariifolium]